jgi:hypothetical protein
MRTLAARTSLNRPPCVCDRARSQCRLTDAVTARIETGRVYADVVSLFGGYGDKRRTAARLARVIAGLLDSQVMAFIAITGLLFR